MRTEPVDRPELVGLIGIVALAAALRLGYPAVVELKLDEALIARSALRIAQGDHFPLGRSTSSTGIPLPPLALYIYALPFLVSSSPLAASLFTAGWNVLGVIACWWMTRRYWGRAAGFWAALLFAANPWAVFFSRKVWEPNLLPPLFVAYLYTALLAFVEGRPWALALHLCVLGAALLVYYSSLPLLGVTLLLLVLFHRRIHAQMLLVGACLCLALAAPFAVFLSRDGSHVWQTALRLLSQPAQVDTQALRLWATLVAGSHIHSLAGYPAYLDFTRSVPYLNLASWAMGALAIGGLLLCLVRAWRARAEPHGQAAGIVALPALSPLIAFTRHSLPVQLHYFLAAWPASFVAAGMLMASLPRLAPARWASLSRVSAGAVVALVVLAQSAGVLALLGFVNTHTTPGGLGEPLSYPLRAARAAQALGEPVVVISAGDDPFYHTWPAVFELILSDTPHRFVDGQRAALFPASTSSLLLTPEAEGALSVYVQAGLVSSFSAMPARTGEQSVLVGRISGQPSLSLRGVQGERLMANGIEWVGYQIDAVPQPGMPFSWQIAWRVAAPWADPNARYHIHNHLLDAQGVCWAQADGPTMPTIDWQVGDLVVQVFHLDVPPEAPEGEYRMRAGMYTYPQLQAQPVLDVAGNPAADHIVVGPLEAD